ncbi:hypothetical protein OBBRIDRAFT_397703 [Obba rivulosa]|uniref:Uncharacterized protein n=1 Tax=Obba rivulosa TaxID=1052685 RepID=A0A8E2AHE7_9APHY|nr:hypothetical protein OBBRIDRAFT_397703 [Obba rivulosa]
MLSQISSSRSNEPRTPRSPNERRRESHLGGFQFSSLRSSCQCLLGRSISATWTQEQLHVPGCADDHGVAAPDDLAVRSNCARKPGHPRHRSNHSDYAIYQPRHPLLWAHSGVDLGKAVTSRVNRICRLCFRTPPYGPHSNIAGLVLGFYRVLALRMRGLAVPGLVRLLRSVHTCPVAFSGRT